VLDHFLNLTKNLISLSDYYDLTQFCYFGSDFLYMEAEKIYFSWTWPDHRMAWLTDSSAVVRKVNLTIRSNVSRCFRISSFIWTKSSGYRLLYVWIIISDCHQQTLVVALTVWRYELARTASKMRSPRRQGRTAKKQPRSQLLRVSRNSEVNRAVIGECKCGRCQFDLSFSAHRVPKTTTLTCWWSRSQISTDLRNFSPL